VRRIVPRRPRGPACGGHGAPGPRPAAWRRGCGLWPGAGWSHPGGIPSRVCPWAARPPAAAGAAETTDCDSEASSPRGGSARCAHTGCGPGSCVLNRGRCAQLNWRPPRRTAHCAPGDSPTTGAHWPRRGSRSPGSHTFFTKRSWWVLKLRSTRPFACGLEAVRTSIPSSVMARVNCVRGWTSRHCSSRLASRLIVEMNLDRRRSSGAAQSARETPSWSASASTCPRR